MPKPKIKPRHKHTSNCAINKTRLFRQYGRIYEQFEEICLQVINNFPGYNSDMRFDIIKETQSCLIRANRIIGWDNLPRREVEHLPWRLMILLKVELEMTREEFYDLPEVEKQIIFLNVHRQSKQIKEIIRDTLVI